MFTQCRDLSVQALGAVGGSEFGDWGGLQMYSAEGFNRFRGVRCLLRGFECEFLLRLSKCTLLACIRELLISLCAPMCSPF